ncbi:MAG: NAD(P)(+) transhydrogenase (Re/Si-specific) subunit beta [Actinomycetota bacterium]|jgi:NAD(P) transhydrogenase subunit beta|nr:NAD(P)(+) transhydrogenase (Re/Si-specific) subunit beta [Actinomycetota bacterium]
MGTVNTIIAFVYLLAAVCFVAGLHLMNSPATARKGSPLSMWAMVAAIAATIAKMGYDDKTSTTAWIVLAAGALIGGVVGLWMARTVKMTAIPQLVSLFNAVGGGAAAVVAIADYVRLSGVSSSAITTRDAVSTVLDVIIGAVTFAGSLIAAGKLQGWITGQPVIFPGARILSGVLAICALGGSGYLLSGADNIPVLMVVLGAALIFGIAMVLPIGGADMPVVIALLNAFTGIAVAMAGFVINNSGLIIAGALVGASGGILTKLMADAMNRSILNIIVGGFGTGDSANVVVGAGGADIRQISAEDAAIQLAYATKVMVVPGYGLAAAQAQHEVRQLAEVLEARGIEVHFAIHPVAGRMPGHMNVLLAEVNVPYTELKEMDEANNEFPTVDVSLVVGANDVTNPAARRPNTPLSGMPILDVDRSHNIIVIKRSMGHGYAGIDNELYADPKTGMFFADAKRGLAEIVAAVKTLVG